MDRLSQFQSQAVMPLMDEEKRTYRERFQDQETRTLIVKVHENMTALRCKFNDKASNKTRNKIWDSIASAVNKACPTMPNRSTLVCKKKWMDLKRSAMKHKVALTATGGGPKLKTPPYFEEVIDVLSDNKTLLYGIQDEECPLNDLGWKSSKIVTEACAAAPSSSNQYNGSQEPCEIKKTELDPKPILFIPVAEHPMTGDSLRSPSSAQAVSNQQQQPMAFSGINSPDLPSTSSAALPTGVPSKMPSKISKKTLRSKQKSDEEEETWIRYLNKSIELKERQMALVEVQIKYYEQMTTKM